MPRETLKLGITTLDQRYNSAWMVKNHQHQPGRPFTLTAACSPDTMAAWPLTWANTAPGGIQQCVGSPLHINIYSCVCVLPRLECEPSFDRHSLTRAPAHPHPDPQPQLPDPPCLLTRALTWLLVECLFSSWRCGTVLSSGCLSRVDTFPWQTANTLSKETTAEQRAHNRRWNFADWQPQFGPVVL